MGLTTLEQFRTELSHTLGDRMRDNTLLDLWINRAYFEVANTGNQQHLKVCVHTDTVSEASNYSIPGDMLAILSAADLTNKTRLIRTSVDDYHIRDRSQRGKPTHYIRRRDTLIFWPTPRREYDIELIYIEQPVPMEDAEDTTILPNFLDHAISLLAARNGLLSLGEDEKATLRYQSAQAYLREQQDETDHSMGSIKEGFGIAHSFEDLTRMRISSP
jgi:hypothetical protein